MAALSNAAYCTEATMDDNSAGEYHTLRIPPGTIVDGAVVELQASPDRTIVNAVVRIDGPAVP